MLFFKQFVMIFGLRRYGELLKSYNKDVVILNIRIFLSQDATIHKYIKTSPQNSSQIDQTLIKMEPRTHPKCSCEAKWAVEERKSN